MREKKKIILSKLKDRLAKSRKVSFGNLLFSQSSLSFPVLLDLIFLARFISRGA